MWYKNDLSKIFIVLHEVDFLSYNHSVDCRKELVDDFVMCLPHDDSNNQYCTEILHIAKETGRILEEMITFPLCGLHIEKSLHNAEKVKKKKKKRDDYNGYKHSTA